MGRHVESGMNYLWYNKMRGRVDYSNLEHKIKS